MLGQKTKNIVNHLLVGGLLFTVPSNLFLILSERFSYVHGLQIDYLLPKFYASDLVILVLSGWLIATKQLTWPKPSQLRPATSFTWVLIGLTGLLVGAQFFSSHPLPAVWQVLKISEMLWLVWLLAQLWPRLQPSWLLVATNASLIFQAGLGLLQFTNQRSVAGYWLLGEPDLSRHLGLAKQVLLGQNSILPYGTTAHPNVLGGFLVLFLLINWSLVGPTPGKKLAPVGRLTLALLASTLIACLTLWLTQSWSALLALVLAALIFKTKPDVKQLVVLIIASCLLALIFFANLPNSSDPSWYRRQYLNQAALTMLKTHPLTGVGLNNFTAQVENFSQTREVVRFSQPAHHTPLLIASETGFLGLLVIGGWLIQLKTKPKWLEALILATSWTLPILVLDHYLFTLQTGLLLFVLLVIIGKKT